MKKTLSTIFLLVMFMASGIVSFGQTFALPREVPIERLVRQNFPNFYDRSNRYQAFIPEGFYPIG